MKSMEFGSNAHSVFLLHYHLVLVVKYRRQVFDERISDRAKKYFSILHLNTTQHLKSWIMTKTISIKEKKSNLTTMQQQRLQEPKTNLLWQ